MAHPQTINVARNENISAAYYRGELLMCEESEQAVNEWLRKYKFKL